jgi:sialate O-acetylesterase
LKVWLGFLLGSLAVASVQAADLALNGVFADHMVLQRQKPVKVWGTASNGEKVTVEFAGQVKQGVADGEGRWKVRLDPLEASAIGRDLLVTGSEGYLPVRIQDVLVGEVWMCGGQSNMEWPIRRSTGKDEILASADQPLLRMGRMDHHREEAPVFSQPVAWSVSSPKMAESYSALPFLFGSALQKKLGIPVGILNTSYGGTRIEAWLSAETLESGPWPQDKNTVMSLAKEQYEKKKAELQPSYDRYLEEKKKAQAEGKPEPKPVEGWPGDFRGPTVLWNGEVAPIAGFSIRGFAWYQGESNAQNGAGPRYLQLLQALAKSYRQAWRHPDLPIVILQLCTYKKPFGYGEIREAQARFVEQDPRSALVVTIDQGAADGDVHPPEKRVVAERFLQAALGLAYGEKEIFQSPTHRMAKVRDGQMVVEFRNTGGSLEARGGDPLHLELAGEDRKFFPATGALEGDRLVVTSPQVPRPVAVRYAFQNFPNPSPNLFGKTGLPVSPFRSDDWAGAELPPSPGPGG